MEFSISKKNLLECLNHFQSVVEKRKVVLKLREELRDLFDSLGACHLQLGKYYKYSELMSNDTLWSVINGVKDVLDPERKVNPGSLGLR